MKTNEQMTTKEKAIESLKEVSGIVSHPEHNTLIADIAHELSQPTLDDAIKVVEEKLQRLCLIKEITREWHYQFNTTYDILTALKGLKEGKEKC